MKKQLLIFISTLISLTLYAQKRVIHNDHLSLIIENGNISLNNRIGKQQSVKQITIPGQFVSVSSVKKIANQWGEGQQLITQYADGKSVCFSLYPSNPFLYITSTLEAKENVLEINRFTLLSVDVDLGKPLSELKVLGSGGLSSADKPLGSFSYNLIADPKSRCAVMMSWLTQKRGVGFVTNKAEGEHLFRMEAGLEFGHFLVDKNEKRSTDTLLIGFFADGRAGLETYGSLLAKAYRVKLPQKPNVYCTWYHRDLTGSGASNEVELTKNAVFAQRALALWGLSVFQIDDHWQDSMLEGIDYKSNPKEVGLGGGPIKTFLKENQNFPSGMAHMAKTINDHGFIAGLWFMPFAGDVHHKAFDKEIFAQDSLGQPYEVKLWSGTCIDATSPQGEAFLRERFKRIHGWGYRYFKIDGLHTGAPSENIYVNRAYDGRPIFGKAKIYNPNMTFVECFRRGLTLLREEAPQTFLLGCAATQNMSSLASAFGLVDAMRVGPDNDSAARGNWKSVTAGADFAGNLYFLNGKVWYNDPDPFYVRESVSLEKARWMASWLAVSGALGTTSNQYSELPPERLDIIKRTLPAHTLNARPVDILEKEKPEIWMVQNNRIHILGLFNWKEKQVTEVRYDMARLGWDNTKSYLAFDYWKNHFIGVIKGEIIYSLDPASCAVLAVREQKDYPQLISTSRHITQGLMDVVSETWHKDSMTLCGTSVVLATDNYEWRVVVPKGLKCVKAICGTDTMKVVTEGELLRVSMVPTRSGRVGWSFTFAEDKSCY
ncbi:MAG: hypothetical protein EOM50_15735 [Erysipelotrichia bacterium]|nr:hypothetical protein [Erysipelotrichia bacterium]